MTKKQTSRGMSTGSRSNQISASSRRNGWLLLFTAHLLTACATEGQNMEDWEYTSVAEAANAPAPCDLSEAAACRGKRTASSAAGDVTDADQEVTVTARNQERACECRRAREAWATRTSDAMYELLRRNSALAKKRR